MHEELARLLPPDRIVTDPVERTVYECDGLPMHSQPPAAVVLCRTREEVIRVVRWCARSGVPFVPRGAGTGLSGGCTPTEGAVVLDTNRMNRILGIDVENRTAIVEPGVVNVHLSAATEPHGFHYAPDPSSQTACTLGGNVAENAGGPHCLKHGVTSDHVLGLEVVLPDGEPVRLGGPLAENPGLDLTAFLVGSEGTLGVVTEITVRLTPNPRAVRTYLAIFDRMGPACRTVSGIIGAGIVPVALEILDQRTIRAIEASVNAAGYPGDAGAALLIELDGFEAGMDEEEAAITRIVEANAPLEFRTARDGRQRDLLWKGRKSAFGTMGRVNTDLYVLDGVVPRTRLEETLGRVYEIAERHGVVVSNVFHAGDGNLHPNISYDGRDAEERERVLAAGREMLEACVALGGTISGEHGIGSEKRSFMPLVLDECDLDLQRALRDAFDPQGIANPGKVFPEPRSDGAEGAVPSAAGDERAATGEPGEDDPAADRAADPSPPAARRDPSPQERVFLADVAAIFAPETGEEAGEIIRQAEAEARTVVPAGFGAHSGAIDPVGPGAWILSAAAFDDVIDYEPEDFTIGVGAGVPLVELKELLAKNHQELPFDLPEGGGGTVGGLVARAPSGPRRGRHGALSPFVLGIEGVRGGGTPFRSGGMLVKNVVGYQIAKLAVGSHGRLGFFTRANFKLRPIPARRRLGLAGVETADEAWRLARKLRASGLEPATLAVLEGDARRVAAGLPGNAPHLPEFVVAWVFEGNAPRATWLADAAGRITAEAPGVHAADLEDGEAQALLGRLAALAEPVAGSFERGIVRLSFRPGGLPDAAQAVRDALAAGDDGSGEEDGWGVWSDAATGLVTVGRSATSPVLGETVGRLRDLAAARSGAARLLHLPPTLRSAWPRDLIPDARAELARRVLESFDPRGVFP